MTAVPTVIDLFCGAGGLSEGMRQAGFRILVGSDFNDAAGRTFKNTHKTAKFLAGPIQDITVQSFLTAGCIDKGELDCLVGGPPCQGFSIYNHKRGMADERSHLFKEYLRIVEGLNPKWIVLENVTGILSTDGGIAVKEICNNLINLGYYVEHRTLKAEEYGVPQERRRVVFLGNRVGLPIVWPEKSHGEGLIPFTTVKDAIGDLPNLLNGQDLGVQKYKHKARSMYQKMIRAGSSLVRNHAAPRLGKINVERMKYIPPGGSWRDIPFDLLPNGMKRAKRSDHTKRYGRMKWDGLSCTILTKCDVHWGAYLHPDTDRAITVREAARIQSFPDWFCFEGSKTEQYVQVGNAVPPLIGRKIGQAILNANNAAIVISAKMQA